MSYISATTTMARKPSRLTVDAADKAKMNQFREDLNQELEHAIEHHEFKMVYIGIGTLALFAGVIYAAVKYPLPFFH